MALPDLYRFGLQWAVNMCVRFDRRSKISNMICTTEPLTNINVR